MKIILHIFPYKFSRIWITYNNFFVFKRASKLAQWILYSSEHYIYLMIVLFKKKRAHSEYSIFFCSPTEFSLRVDFLQFGTPLLCCCWLCVTIVIYINFSWIYLLFFPSFFLLFVDCSSYDLKFFNKISSAQHKNGWDFKDLLRIKRIFFGGFFLHINNKWRW